MANYKVKRYTEDEMLEAACKMAETISIREYVNGSSHDFRRETTPEEQAAMTEIFYAALLSLNSNNGYISIDTIQAIKNMAEFSGQIRLKESHANCCDSIYCPLQRYVDQNLLVKEHGQEYKEHGQEYGER